jgi:hypothetical protein
MRAPAEIVEPKLARVASPASRAIHPSAARLRLRRIVRKLAFAFAVAVIVSPAILVFLWMLSLSLKNELEAAIRASLRCAGSCAWREDSRPPPALF